MASSSKSSAPSSSSSNNIGHGDCISKYVATNKEVLSMYIKNESRKDKDVENMLKRMYEESIEEFEEIQSLSKRIRRLPCTRSRAKTEMFLEEAKDNSLSIITDIQNLRCHLFDRIMERCEALKNLNKP